MDAVRAPDRRRVFEFDGAALQDVGQFLQIGQENVRRLLNLDIEARILDVGRREPQVNVFRFIADVLADAGQKRDDVVIDFRVDFVNAIHVEIRFFANDLDGFFRNAAELGIRFAGGDFHIQHRLPFVSFIPDFFHFRAGVSRYHLQSPFGFPSRFAISRPTMTPAAEACASPRVMPAPSPMAKK